MFEKARIKLTLWYLAIIMAISLFYSAAIYFGITNEFRRFERMEVRIEEDIEGGRVSSGPGRNNPMMRIGRADPEFIQESKTRILVILGIVNVGIITISGIAGYFLAGKTLTPIKKNVDEQNRFITDASHELRTPLTALRSEIEVALRGKTLSNQQARKILQSNLEEVLSLQALSDNLLELAQNGTSIDPNAVKNISVGSIVQTAIKKTLPLAKKKQIVIKNKVENSKVEGASDRLVEVFVILLDNAIKYSFAKGVIEISSSTSKNKVEITVIDYGKGIDSKDIPYIFNRFYRADKSRSQHGYGLGLSIAKKIIDAHHGALWVKSVPQKTTEFTVVLPKSQEK